MLTPKVIGVAIARYDFSSRDTRELSLQEGDVVKIYTKAGANGWWRGEVNGRVGLLSLSRSRNFYLGNKGLICSSSSSICFLKIPNLLLLLLLLLQVEFFFSEVLMLKKQTRKLIFLFI